MTALAFPSLYGDFASSSSSRSPTKKTICPQMTFGIFKAKMASTESEKIVALPVKQWLAHWDSFKYDARVFRRKPKNHFYILSMNARTLKALCGIQRRQIKPGEERSREIGIQRRHEQARSEEISRYV